MIDRLAHYAVRAADLEVSKAFYAEALGLCAGPRPPFDFPGVWLYPEGDSERRAQGCVHLIGSGQDGALGGYLGDRPAAGGPDTGSLDHIAFFATDWPACRERLTRLRAPFTERIAPLLKVRQVFVTDPDGITIELNFPAES